VKFVNRRHVVPKSRPIPFTAVFSDDTSLTEAPLDLTDQKGEPDIWILFCLYDVSPLAITSLASYSQ